MSTAATRREEATKSPSLPFSKRKKLSNTHTLNRRSFPLLVPSMLHTKYHFAKRIARVRPDRRYLSNETIRT
ncbi:hypothetical protein M5K25_007905 [Dendrobium thyrsiflorum]|uniref:Uncharacterized protein n=1 Tax=Dendrobium thyrsiflorum TaxID=117978 RepID=A0ABD0V7E6_DENTH